MRSKTVSLPGYVVMWQFLSRMVLLVTVTVATCVVYMKYSLSDCMMDRGTKVSSYFCLNEYTVEKTAEHKGSLFYIGITCALVAAIIMFIMSQTIFRNFTRYLDKLIAPEEEVEANPFVIKQQITVNLTTESMKQ